MSMYVCIYIYIHIYIHIHIYTYTYMYTYKYIHTHAYTYMHIYINIHKHICVYIFLFLFFSSFFSPLFSLVSFFRFSFWVLSQVILDMSCNMWSRDVTQGMALGKDPLSSFLRRTRFASATALPSLPHASARLSPCWPCGSRLTAPWTDVSSKIHATSPARWPVSHLPQPYCLRP